MHIVRYVDRSTNTIHVGVRDRGAVRPLPVSSIGNLLRRSLDEIRDIVTAVDAAGVHASSVAFLPPIDGQTEVWAAGVTYRRSRDARMEESTQASIYDLVYQAPRPEVFFKSVPWKVVTDGDLIAVRADSPSNVPEAEFALVINAHAQIVAYAVCNDVSSRSIEGANPLYLPQAKIYAASCAISSGLRPSWEVADPNDLDIAVVVTRGDKTVWRDSISTSEIMRTFNSLVECAFDEQEFPEGVILSTGTGLVPAIEFTLERDDWVSIEIASIGILANRVVVGKAEVGQAR